MDDEWARVGPFLVLLGGDEENVCVELGMGVRFVARTLPTLVAALATVTWLSEAERGTPITVLVAVACAGAAWLLYPRTGRA